MNSATAHAERVVFVSTFAKHRIVMRSPRQKYNAQGDVLDFDPGKTLEFENNRYETSVPEEIEYLKGRLGPGLVMLTPAEAADLTPARRVHVVETTSTTSKAEGRREYRCPYCARSFSDPLTKGRHISAEHRQEKAAEKAAAAPAETPTP